jgi:predicted hotdog family 3-hydroxylacyl-ACP dehydratase
MINFAIPMLANREDILKFIPQRRPIVMVHQLATADDDSATTHFDIEPDNVFIDDGHFAEPGMVENIAQTAAVHIGYQCSRKNIPIPIGYIAAIKDLKVKGLPLVNSTITTSVKVVNKVLDITVVQGMITQGSETLCTCEMRIFAKLQS